MVVASSRDLDGLSSYYCYCTASYLRLPFDCLTSNPAIKVSSHGPTRYVEEVEVATER